MALYVIGDLHLSLSGNKSMDIFPGWHNYVDRTRQNWLAKIQPEDTVVLAGDTSWGMSFAEAKADFEFVNALPGQKIILKGNHDYWWATMNKMNAFFAENGFDTLHILHNNHYLVEGICVCGSRGWLFDQGEPADQKVIAREAGRLEEHHLLRRGHPGGEGGVPALSAGVWRAALSGDHRSTAPAQDPPLLLRTYPWNRMQLCLQRQLYGDRVPADLGGSSGL